MDSLYGFKLDQSQAFDKEGRRVPVTIVKIEPHTVIRAGNNFVQVAIGHKKHLKKPTAGMLKSIQEKISPRFIREVKMAEGETKGVGNKVQIADVFNSGDRVKATGISKGKGFAGVVKRHGFAGGPKTHGQSDRQRHPGSIGQTTTPGRVYKGKRMAGHMGNTQKTVRNLAVFDIKPEENLLLIRGLIPGAKGGLVKITKI